MSSYVLLDALLLSFSFFFFNDTATTEIYTLSLHDALPISSGAAGPFSNGGKRSNEKPSSKDRSEEHTSELQSQSNLVCRLLLEKKKNTKPYHLMYNCCILPESAVLRVTRSRSLCSSAHLSV